MNIQKENLTVLIRDNNGKPVLVRAAVFGSDEKSYFPFGTHTLPFSGGMLPDWHRYFYADGSFTVSVPQGNTLIAFYKGLEYLPVLQPINVPAGGISTTIIFNDRVIDMAKQGWYSSDSHFHRHVYVNNDFPESYIVLALRAEDLKVGCCHAYNYGTLLKPNLIIDREYFTGTPSFSADCLLQWCEEYRSLTYGHIAILGCPEWIGGPEYTWGQTDYPCSHKVALKAVEKGAVVQWAHPFMHSPIFSSFGTHDGNNAIEWPVSAVLGSCHAIEIINYHSNLEIGLINWYKMLNCGIRMAISGTTDMIVEGCGKQNPIGGNRVYVKVDGEFNMRSWLNGFKNGKTFATNGPMVFIDVEGKEIGDTLSLSTKRDINVTAKVESVFPVDTLEIIVNGQVVASKVLAEPQNGVIKDTFTTSIPISHSSWIAARCLGTELLVEYQRALAHTSPIYVMVNNQPLKVIKGGWNESDGQYFVDWIEKLIQGVIKRNKFPSQSAKEETINIFRQAQEKYKGK